MRTKPQRDVPLWEQEATWCIHFNGLMNDACDLGIVYNDLPAGPRVAYRRELPCLKESPSEPTRCDICPSVEYLTEEQARAKADATLERLHERLKREADGCCPECDQKVEQKVQVGRCVYGRPCGHRQYQGRLP